MSNHPIEAVILAAGRGKRMASKVPKVLHQLGGKVLIEHIIDTVSTLDEANVTVVTSSSNRQQIYEAIGHRDLQWIEQNQLYGTAQAALQALPALDPKGIAIILCGDVPLISEATLTKLLEAADEAIALLTFSQEETLGYGRIVRDKTKVKAIVEEKNATKTQQKIKELFSGIIAAPVTALQQFLPQITANEVSSEYYLTDIAALAIAADYPVHTVETENPYEVAGVNDLIQLAKLERHYQYLNATKLMEQGVVIADPARFDLRGAVTVASKDVFIDINALLIGNIVLGEGVTIGANCVIRDSVLQDGAAIRHNSVVEEAVVGQKCVVGPFARLRPGTHLSNHVTIGNYVETKNSSIGEHTKVSHLSYIGDTQIGNSVNVGAGTITCNFDGQQKHPTRIDDGAFIGSNTALVAPVVIGSKAKIGAGSVITENVPQDTLSIGRALQKNLDKNRKPRTNGDKASRQNTQIEIKTKSDKRGRGSSYSDKGYGDRNYGNRSRGDRNFDDRRSNDRNYGDRGRGDRNFGDRRSNDRNYGDRSRGDRNFGDRRSNDRNYGDRSRGDRNFGDRSRGDRNFGDRSRGDRNFGDRSRGDRNFGDRSRGDRGRGDRNFGDRSRGDRNFGDRSRGDRNFGNKGYGDKNYGDKSRGNKNYGDEGDDDKNYGDEVYGTKSYGDKDSSTKSYGDKDSSTKSYGDKGYGDKDSDSKIYDDKSYDDKKNKRTERPFDKGSKRSSGSKFKKPSTKSSGKKYIKSR